MTSTPTRLIAALSAAVLLVLAAAVPAYATRTPAPWVTGVLVDDAGVPIPNTPVWLTAWPGASQLATLAVDDEVPTLDVATSTTDENGAFAFTVNGIVEDQLQYLADNFVVDLTVDAQVGDEYFSYSTSRYLSGLVAASGGDPTPPVEIDDSPITLAPVGTITNANDPGTQPAGTPPACPWKRIANLGGRWVSVGQGYTTNSTTMKLTYEAGTTSSIGVGISVGGGAFKASGTSSITSKSTITFPTATGVTGRTWRTQFVFAKYRRTCYGTTSTQVKAVSFAGGATYITLTTPPTTTYCTVYVAPSDFETNLTRATTLSAGTSGDIGIQLSASTGYSNTLKLSYHFAVGKRLCGKNDYPGGAPGTLVAKI